MKQYLHIILCASLMVLAGCDKLPNKKPKQENPPIRVKVQTLEEQTHTYTHTYVGRIEEVSSVPLSAQIAGQVLSVKVKTGDRVKVGQELLRIDDTQARNALQAAQATFQQAQDGYQRAKQVYAEGGVTEQKMVEINSQLKQAESMLSISQKSLNDCVLRAPIAGVIGECRVHVGQTIAPAVPVITLLDMNGYNVALDVPEADIATIQPGEIGSIVVAAAGQDTLPIRVVEKNLLANTIAHTYTVKAMLLRGDSCLLPGMVSKVWLQSQRVSGFFVPLECVQTMPTGKSVWVVNGNVATRRNIEVGEYVAGGVLITKGLHAGDQVVVEGFQKMYNGAKVVF
ncbi:MAG: efflux RND transporter periplasmic adaptor subunit [Bacteroidales bacterium]|nr:efflux RND transporter periplasmic adaptor subunit [Bacteroidales bacterium]